jgi:hypothetical protein
MLVKELIEKLKSLPEDSQVVIEYTDHTDYHYVVPMNENEVRFESKLGSDNFMDVFYVGEDDEEEQWKDVTIITFKE